MGSHGAGRRAGAFKKPAMSGDPIHGMHHQQHESLLRKTYMPFVTGPENRHNFASFEEKDSNSFLKFHPYAPPFGPNYPLFPHRDDVPLVDPCSGLVSAGGDADLRPNVRRAIESLVDYNDVKPQQRVPMAGKGVRTAHRRHMILVEEISQDRRWNSRAVPAASIRAQLRGQTTPVKVSPALPGQQRIFAFCMDPNLKERNDPSASWREEKVKDYFYKSSTQKAYEEVPWDNILPSKIQPPESTMEVMADPVSQCFTKKRYNPEADISQVIGSLWDRLQRRYFTPPQRPVNFVSRSSRICQIPFYTGCVGAVDFEDIDNPSADFIMFNCVQTSKPHYASTAHTPNIPGYTGKVHWSATHPANSNLPSTSPSIISQMHGAGHFRTAEKLYSFSYYKKSDIGIGPIQAFSQLQNSKYIAKHGRSSLYNHQGPFSQMMTPVSPQNSFNKTHRETIIF